MLFAPLVSGSSSRQGKEELAQLLQARCKSYLESKQNNHPGLCLLPPLDRFLLDRVLANVLHRRSSGQQGTRRQSGHLLAKASSLLQHNTNQRRMMRLLLPNRAARKRSPEDRVGLLQFLLGRSPLSHKYQFLLQLKRHQRSTSLGRMVQSQWHRSELLHHWERSTDLQDMVSTRMASRR
jgi:hypothetical protein